MNIMEEIFDIRSCIQILGMISKSTQLINICSSVIKNYKKYIPGDLHPLGGRSELGIYDLFWVDYKVFVPGYHL